MGRLYRRVAESRRWMVDALVVFVLVCGVVQIVAWWMSK